ncbi:hypothetical protein PX554_26185 [Sphingomonas sp. H39-1-10]|uniref:hypothetical protein n=1 Tax=Sphingomonas pollutisoli TaxID=3030829 RepID=UPI0023B997CD|nr:hypothetical protein [Sphingomonas pollutisoli]MDF0491608.1 hypothetical protein [Sphingomonas pollutisoli]
MSTAYVSAAPKARTEGDMLWLELQSGDETMSFALTRNAALNLLRAVMQETRGPLFAAAEGQILPFGKPSRKRSAKKRGAKA